MNNIIMKLEDIDKFYMETGNKLHILKKLNLEVKRGEFVSILGKSGSGKSTLLNIMGLLDKIDGGKIWIDDKEVSSLNEIERNNIKNHFLGFVFQFHYLMSEFTALENVMIPALLNNFKNKKEIEKEAISCIEKAFERMASIKTNNNLSLFDEDEKNDIEEAEIVEVTEPGNSNQNLLEDKTDKKEEDNPDEVDKTDEIEEEKKPKKRGRKPKNQNRDEE